jgi:threonine dehydrogenase-like Zn-dependent dehydrogenase
MKHLGVCGTDIHAFEGNQPYFNYPRVLGHELSCKVVGVKIPPQFQTGDAITVIPYVHCGKCIACRRGATNCCA